jgi:sigma-E factor negative regulatory protein RseB
MLTAALAVGVPGCLLSLAACGGQASSRQPQGQTQAVAKKTAAPAQPQRAQSRKKSSPLAMTLLTEAAQEGVQQTYQGEEIVSRWDNSGNTTLVSEVWHQSGGLTVTQTLATASNQPFVSGDPDGQSPEGVLGVTTTLVQLLEDNYVLSYKGNGAFDNRPAQVVQAWRADGSLAAEYWLDTATKLPLERQVYDTSKQLISMSYFVDVKIGTSATAPGLVTTAQPRADLWSYPIAPLRLLTLTRQGWVVPAALPGGLTLFTGGETDTPTGQVLDLAYSDGLYVVSVFEQHGKLAAKLSGWQKTKVAGQIVYTTMPDQRSFTWSGKDDVVYTVIADAPPQTVVDVVGKLPHDEPPGFWKRMSRGFDRLAHLVNPFG